MITNTVNVLTHVITMPFKQFIMFVDPGIRLLSVSRLYKYIAQLTKCIWISKWCLYAPIKRKQMKTLRMDARDIINCYGFFAEEKRYWPYK